MWVKNRRYLLILTVLFFSVFVLSINTYTNSQDSLTGKDVNRSLPLTYKNDIPNKKKNSNENVEKTSNVSENLTATNSIVENDKEKTGSNSQNTMSTEKVRECFFRTGNPDPCKGRYPPIPIQMKIMSADRPIACKIIPVSAEMQANISTAMIYHWKFNNGERTSSIKVQFNKDETKKFTYDAPYIEQGEKTWIGGNLIFVTEFPIQREDPIPLNMYSMCKDGKPVTVQELYPNN